ncbi:MAG: hypothetical protein AAF957_27195 [Planctomycetota bacterium]
MKHCLALAPLAALLAPAALAQVQGGWEVSSGLLPDDVVPAFVRLVAGPCTDGSASLSPTELTIDDVSPCPEDVLVYRFEQPAEPGTGPDMHRAEARLRVVQSTGSDPDQGVAFLGMSPAGGCGWSIYVDTGSVKLFRDDQEIGRTTLDATVMRTYRIQANTTTGTVALFVDGVLRVGGSYPPTCFAIGSPRTVTFGNLSGRDGGVTQWEFVRHNLLTGDSEFCVDAQTANSTGAVARTSFLGSRSVAANDLVLQTGALPPGTVGYYLCSRSFGSPLALPAGDGTLCLRGGIGRFNRAGEILFSDATGSMFLPVDLADLPQPSGPIAALPGDTWHFQLWYRDSGPVPTSNTSTALQLVLE